MPSGWDRTSPGFLAEWLPRLAPYDRDFAAEMGLREGCRVLSTAGPEVVALAREVGDRGTVHAVDADEDVRFLCQERVVAAGLAKRVELRSDRGSTPYDVAVSVFELAFRDDAASCVRAMREAIGPNGKVAIMAWGPAGDADPERVFAQTIDEIAPEVEASGPSPWPLDRASLGELFERAGLVVVRHTVVSHAIVFPRAERFARALLAARSYGPRLMELGEARVASVLARFYERAFAQDAPISYTPAATIAIGALPGAEVDLPHRPSVRVPSAS